MAVTIQHTTDQTPLRGAATVTTTFFFDTTLDAITNYGHVWSTSPNPTTTLTTKTSLGAKTGVSGSFPFNSSLTGLADVTAYYVRPYYINGSGTTYGEEYLLETQMYVTDYGFYYGLTPDTLTKVSMGNGISTISFFKSVTNLTTESAYYCKAYTTTDIGTAYGDLLVIETRSAISDYGFAYSVINPSPIKTNNVISLGALGSTNQSNLLHHLSNLNPTSSYYMRPYITRRTGTFYGDVAMDETNMFVEDYGFYYGSMPDASTKISMGNGLGTVPFSKALTGLTSEFTYYGKAYTTTAVGTAYGDVLITETPSTISDSGLVYSYMNPAPTITDGMISLGVPNNTNNSDLNHILSEIYDSTSYYMRSYITRRTGTFYGEVIVAETNLTLNDSGFMWSAKSNLGENLLETVGGGAHQDWTKWSHYAGNTYWGIREQYDHPAFGKVNKLTKDGATNTAAYLYDYYPYSYEIEEVYTFSLWMRSNKTISKPMNFYINSSVGGQHTIASKSQTVSLVANEWQYVSWTSSPVSEATTGTGGFGVEMNTGWGGVILEVARPAFERGVAVSRGVHAEGVNFSHNLIGLSDGAMYYTRPYTVTALGRTYGGQTIVETQLVLTEHGFVYSLVSNKPTIDHNKISLGIPTNPSTFSNTPSGLNGGTLHYMRPYASTKNEVFYGDMVLDETIIESIEHGFVHSKTANPTVNHTKLNIGRKSGIGVFTASATSLDPETNYYIKSYVMTSAGTSYGAETTLRTSVGTVILGSTIVNSYDDETVTVTGSVSKLNSLTITEHGHVWATSSNPTTANNKSTLGTKNTTDPFTSNISGLNRNTTYYIRSYAVSSYGLTGYGEESSFTTQTGLASLTTGTASSITNNSFSIGGNISALNGENVTAHGHVWATTINPTLNNESTNLGTRNTTGVFTSSIPDLAPNTTYNVRSYVTTAAGTTYGSNITVKTLNEKLIAPPSPKLDSRTETTLTLSVDTTLKGIHFEEAWEGLGSYIRTATTVNNIDGVLNVTSTTYDPTISMYNIGSFDPTIARYIEMRYRIVNSKATNWEIFFTNSTYTTAMTSQRVSGNALVTDGTWQVAVIDGWNHASWKTEGNITGFRLDWATASGVQMEIDYVRITSDPLIVCNGETKPTGSTWNGLTLATGYPAYSYLIGEGAYTTSNNSSPVSIFTVTPPSSVSSTKAVFTGGKIKVTGVVSNTYNIPTETGFVWSTTNSVPTLSDTKSIAGYYTETSTFNHEIADITKGTYYIRSYAINEGGTVYGSVLTVATDKIVLARLKEGVVHLQGEINERLPVVTNGLVSHHPFDGTVQSFIPNQVRYIRDWLNGSTANTSNHWVEIQAVDYDGVNVAFEKSGTSSAGTWNTLLTNNVTTTNPYWGVGTGVTTWVQIDLGDSYTLEEIKVWHYWGDGRTYYKTKTEVSLDGINWFVIFDSAVEGTYKEVSTGKTHSLANLGITVRPSLDTNTTLTNNGIAVEEDAVNIWNGNLGIYNNYTVPASLVKLDETYMEQPVYRLGMTVSDAKATYLSHFRTSLTAHGVVGGSQSWVQDTKYASSIYWRPVNKEDVVFGGTASNTGGWITGPTEYLDDGWRRYTRYRTGAGVATKSDSVHHSFYCPSMQLNETVYIDVACPQTEKDRTFATSYTPSSRMSGSLTIPSSIGNSNFTIVGEFTPNEDSDKLSNSCSFLSLGGGFILRTYDQRPYIDGNAIAGVSGNNVHMDFNTKPGVKTQFVIMRNGTTFTWRMKSDDGQDVTWTKTHENVPNINVNNLTFSPTWGGRFKNISTYNRALSDKEVKKLYSPSFQVRKTGQLISNKVIEKVTLPREATHIPFDLDATSTNKVAIPTTESNVVYEDGSIWVGGAVTNLITSTTSTGMTKEEDAEWTKWTSTSGGQINYLVSKPSLEIGQKYTASFVARNPTDKPIYFSLNLLEKNQGFVVQPNDKKKIVYTMSSTLMSNTAVDPGGLRLTFIDTNDVLWIKNVQIEKGTYASAYTEGARGLSALRYDVNKLLTNTWEEFTFVLQAKYSASGDYRLSGAWSKWYFGVHANGGLVFSWVDGSQKTTTSSGVSVPIGEWVTIGVTVKNGGGVDLYYNGNRVGGIASGLALPNTNNTFHLNGFDGGSSYSLNAFVRDAIFVSRVLTAEEMKQLYSANMRALKNGLQVKTNVYEAKEFHPVFDIATGILPSGMSMDGYELTHKGNINEHLAASGVGQSIDSAISTPIEAHASYLTHTPYGVATGANDKTISLSPAPSSYQEGFSIAFRNTTQNTGAVRIQINSLGFKEMLNSNGIALGTGALKANSIYTIYYDGTSFRM